MTTKTKIETVNKLADCANTLDIPHAQVIEYQNKELTKFYESDSILPNLSGDTMFKVKHKLNMYTKRLLG